MQYHKYNPPPLTHSLRPQPSPSNKEFQEPRACAHTCNLVAPSFLVFSSMTTAAVDVVALLPGFVPQRFRPRLICCWLVGYYYSQSHRHALRTMRAVDVGHKHPPLKCRSPRTLPPHPPYYMQHVKLLLLYVPARPRRIIIRPIYSKIPRYTSGSGVLMFYNSNYDTTVVYARYVSDDL